MPSCVHACARAHTHTHTHTHTQTALQVRVFYSVKGAESDVAFFELALTENAEEVSDVLRRPVAKAAEKPADAESIAVTDSDIPVGEGSVTVTVGLCRP